MDLNETTYSAGFELLKNAVQHTSTRNVLISPLSILFTISVCAVGASGETFREMMMTISNSKLTDGQCEKKLEELVHSFEKLVQNEKQICISNAILVHKNVDVRQDYEKFLKDVYDVKFSKIQDTDDLVPKINSWFHQKTNGKISNMIETIDKNTAIAVVLNAVYFKEKFESPFSKNKSRQKSFYSFQNKSPCVMMNQDFSSIHHKENDLIQAIKIPTEHGTKFVVILPKKKGKAEFMNVLNTMDKATNLNGFEIKCGSVQIPKFEFECKHDLETYLANMGMKRCFSKNHAEFDNILRNENEKFYIDSMRHSTFIKVDEDGIEAAAATLTTFNSNIDPTFRFIANRPFIFAIEKENIGLIFVGCITKL